MPEYVIPQVQVFQSFTQTPTEITNPLRAFVFGPHYQLVPYSSGSSSNSLLGQYDPDPSGGYTAYSYPSLPAGGVVDESYTALYIENALLRYWSEPAGSGNRILAVPDHPNRIRWDGGAFKDNTSTYPRSAAHFYSRDVAVGDVVRLFGTWDGTVYEKWTTVTGFAADEEAAVIGNATNDANNAATHAGSTTHAQTGGVDNRVDISSVSATNYDGSDDLGGTTETYTITCVTGSVDGSGAIVSVTSASGNDDDATQSVDIGDAIDIGARGLTVTWTRTGHFIQSSSSSGGSGASKWYGHPAPSGRDMDDMIPGQEWTVTVNQTWTAPTVTTGGTFGSSSDTTYIVNVTEGGTTPRITVSTTNGLDSSGPTDVVFGSAVTVGTLGVTLTFTGNTRLAYGDKYYVQCTGTKSTYYRTLILADNVPYHLRAHGEMSSSSPFPGASGIGQDLNVELFIKKNFEIPELRTAEPNGGSSSSSTGGIRNWDAVAREFRVYDDVYGYDSGWTDANGDQIGMLIKKDSDGNWSKIYLKTRYLLQSKADAIYTISSVSDVATTLGTVHSDNPLALGVYYALLNSNGTAVKYMAVPTNDSTGYSTALSKAEGRSDVYSFVPLTKTAAIHTLVQGHVDSMSNEIDGRWRVAFINRNAAATSAVVKSGLADAPGSSTTYTADEVVCTVTDDTSTATTDYVIVDWNGGNFVTQGVAANDVFRVNYAPVGDGTETYEEYTIDSVVSNERLRLVSGPSAPVSVESRFEVHLTNSKDTQASTYGAIAGSFANRRVNLIWPDYIEDASGVQVDGFYLCAALAGLASGVTPQQGLTNVQVSGFSGASRTIAYFSDTQLNTMAGLGVWIVTEDFDTGEIFTRHQTTTNVTTTEYREFNIVKNVDSISYVFQNRLKRYIGKANVTPGFLDVLRRAILSTRDFLLTSGYTALTGGQLNGATLVDLRQHLVYADRVQARLELDIPYPVNNILMYLVV